MSKIAFLGFGAMGSRMAPPLIKAGHDVTVWDRSLAAVTAAVARGARSAATPCEAAEGAEFVFSMLTDDDASKAVWMTADTGALAGLSRAQLPSRPAGFRPNGSEALPRPWKRVVLLCWVPQSWDPCRKLNPPSSSSLPAARRTFPEGQTCARPYR
jgi:NAD binding domain of 6-phosphogluconate dehydrogenase